MRRAARRAARRAERRAARRRRLTLRGLGVRFAASTAVLSVVAALGPRMFGPRVAYAASFEVTNLNDAGAGSLRDALTAANGTAGPDLITFTSGLTGTVTLTSGQLTISDSVQIVGPGRGSLTVSGGGASRVFDIPLSPGDVNVALSGLTVSNGRAQTGGGIRVQDESLSLDDVALTGNTALGNGGGLFADGFAMTLTVRNSTISGNAARGGGGAYIEDTKGVTLFDGVVIDGNTASEQGGGIFFYDPDNNVVIENATISNNTARKGGGIYLYSQDNGSFSISKSTVSGNQATTGGGVYLYDIDHPATISNSTISGNTAVSGAGVNIDRISAPATITNSTISGNTATGPGGGVRLGRGGGLSIAHSTITANAAADAGGARFPGPVSISHVIVTGNTAASTADLQAAGGVTADFSIIGTMTGAVTDGGGNQLGVTNAMLGPLANNGGPTRTHLPLVGSQAIDTGNPAVSAPATDQRGLARIVGVIDIGAVEVIPAPVTPPTSTVVANTVEPATIPPLLLPPTSVAPTTIPASAAPTTTTAPPTVPTTTPTPPTTTTPKPVEASVAPQVITEPTNRTVTAGATVTFTAAAVGRPTPSVQWQRSTDGGRTFTDIPGQTSTTFGIRRVSLSLNGRRYRAVFTNAAGTATSKTVTLTVRRR